MGVRAVDRDERELGRDEERGRCDQSGNADQSECGVYRVTIRAMTTPIYLRSGAWCARAHTIWFDTLTI